MMVGDKPRVAFFDFACCEGCQLTVLELEESLLDLLQHVKVVTWREVMTESSDSYDIAFCEGSITREQDIERINRIRETANILVSLGTCASIGCHNAIKNKLPMRDALEIVYGSHGAQFDTIPARPITAVVEVDYQVLGCPVSLPEFVSVFKHILTGTKYFPSNDPVCVECKRNDHLCVFEKGVFCLGPITRCGCNAICTAYGDACHGCRGLLDDANLTAALKLFTAERVHSIMSLVRRREALLEEDIRRKFAIYNNWPELSLEGDPGNGT